MDRNWFLYRLRQLIRKRLESRMKEHNNEQRKHFVASLCKERMSHSVKAFFFCKIIVVAACFQVSLIFYINDKEKNKVLLWSLLCINNNMRFLL